MVIHDSRLEGTTPAYHNYVFQVGSRGHIRDIVEVTARDTQYYHINNGPIYFGSWEGPVAEFSEANPQGRIINDPSRYRVQRDRASAS